jgi:hypothetical protein
MFTIPSMMSTSNSATVMQADVQANTALQNRFPGWTYVNGQYYTNGKPHKAHIKDHSGQIWTVWFNANEQITHYRRQSVVRF